MFWTRKSREARRRKVLDELLAMDPNDRRGRLDVAVVAGDVRADEVESALRLVGRLDALRVMTIPPSRLLPGGIVPIGEGVRARHAALDAVNAAAPAADVGEDDGAAATADSDSTDTLAELGRGRVALATRSGRRSSRRRRERMAFQVPASTEASVVPETAVNPPSMEWLRP